MLLPTVAALKEHLNLTSDETDFDNQCQRNLSAATQKVCSYLNRTLYETVPTDPAEGYLVVNESVNRCILEIAGYYLDSKGSVNAEVIENILDAFVGQYRVVSFA